MAVLFSIGGMLVPVDAYTQEYGSGPYGAGDYNVGHIESSSSAAHEVPGGAGGRRGIVEKINDLFYGISSSPHSRSSRVRADDALPSRGDSLSLIIESRQVTFRDVPVSEWFATYIHDLIRKGIASGYESPDGQLLGLYGPADPVTYAEIVKMALEAAEKTDHVTTAPHNRVAVILLSEHLKDCPSL